MIESFLGMLDIAADGLSTGYIAITVQDNVLYLIVEM